MTTPKSNATDVVFSSRETSALGQVMVAAYKPNNIGLPRRAMRTLGYYTLDYVLDGSGTYRDGNGQVRQIRTGDLLLFFPDLPHFFAPGEGEHWSDLYLIFEGPAFDLWRAGLPNPVQPVYSLLPVEKWLPRFQSVWAGSADSTPPSQTLMVTRLLSLLAEITAATAEEPRTEHPPWLATALHLMGNNLREPLRVADLARRCGMHEETFRKQFQKAMGVSPARYRAQKRLQAARALLQNTTLESKEIARDLGFAGNTHFTDRFKLETGMTPVQFRKAPIQRHASLEQVVVPPDT